jgi:cell division protein FtsW
MRELYNKIYGDKVIWGVIISLGLLSIPIIHAGTAPLIHAFKGGNHFYFVFKHGIILLFAFVIAYQTSKIKHGYLSRISLVLMGITVPLLLYTMFSGYGVSLATRWIKIPIVGLSFQTSDLAKISLIIYLARVLSKKQGYLGDIKEVIKHLFLPVFFMCALVVKSDFSTAALIMGICLIMMFFGGVKISHFTIILGGLVLVFLALITIFPDWFPRLPTWKHRLELFLSGEGDDDGNYQKFLAQASVWDGGPVGLWFSNNGKYGQPPQAASDFIFATILRNYGIAGGIFTIGMYLLLLFRSIIIAKKAKKLFSTLLVVGLSAGIVLQAFSNMAVAVGLFPVTGQPLPMVSMGGTSLWFTAISIGIILSVSREVGSNSDVKENEKS